MIPASRPRDGSGQTRLGSGWAGLLGRLGCTVYTAQDRRAGPEHEAHPAQKPVGLTRPAKTPNFAPKSAVLGAKRGVLEADYDNNYDKTTIFTPRIAHLGSPAPARRVLGLGWAAPPSQPRPAGLGYVQHKTRPSPAHLEAYPRVLKTSNGP